MEKSGQGRVGLPLGSKIGKYVIREKLGSGGQAIVYKCYGELLDRYVAIKQISTKLAEDPRFLERFRKEAQILAKLGAEQPAVVSIYELIEDTNGLFIVMEFAEGRSLETILADTDGPIDPKAGLQIIWRMAGGLHAVHEAGVVHRDIKPSNIIVSEGLRVKITDFGVAAGAAEQTSMLMGTTKYMAPELFEGETFDARADMYSLGFIAYEMLVGRARFNEIFADVVRDRQSEAVRWMKWHGKAKVKAPPLSEVNPSVPSVLSDIVAKMMAKDPDERFESMEMLGRAIKLAFSPRGKAPAPQAAAPGPVRPGAPREARPAPSAAPDEADHLEIPPGVPLTAPLPRRRLSLRTKLILAGFCALCVVGVGIILGVQGARRRQALEHTAKALYDEADRAYKQQDYALAAERFAEAGREYGKTSPGVRASVMVHLARARQAMIDHDWATARKSEEEARRRAELVLGHYDDQTEWAEGVIEEIGAFGTERMSTQGFIEAMAKARAALDGRQYDEARAILGRELTSVTPSVEQEREWREFLREVDFKEFTGGVDEALAAGRTLAEDGKFEEAMLVYSETQRKLASSDAGVLSDEQRKQMADRIAAIVQETQDEQAHQRAMTDAQTARRRNDKRGEVAALRRAVKIRPSKEHQARISELRSDISLDQGRALLAGGKIEQARVMIGRALKQNPANAAAKAELAQIDKTVERDKIVLQAKADFDARDYTAALAKYKQAAQLRSDPAIAARITECRFLIDLAAADALRDAKKYEEALAAYEALRGIKAGEGVKIDARQAEVRGRQAYEDEIAQGDAAVAQQRWGEALRHFRRANDMQPSREAEQRIIGARYIENVTKGKAAMDNGDLRMARAYFKTALKYKETKEVKDLIEQVNRKMEEE